ncbi:23S rRNA (uracil(1939)-C(5))-methyltransferase RlmD [uncultured Porphyromonas sp.]|uniref:23S rRNA (uracil(1939)-C(5))-methyltransferase RlmD n=1 Tax=uncultured Porphyromonas sp. TaxID=159274 RepID=UPI0026038E88|nr:23S rRNA (uracil(1939)-C(5))-methyltransferase RlmD [uncultured Porphyromonas sp.]
MARKNKVPEMVEGIRIERMAAEGRCIGHLEDGRVLFVPYSAPGDLADITLGRRRKAYAEGRIAKLLEPSSSRVEPRCTHFGLCGGCKWQHLDYEVQLEGKQQQVADQLERVGHLELGEMKMHKIIGSEATYDYRNKLEFTFSNHRWLSNEELSESSEEEPTELSGLGFHVPRMFDKVLDIEECHLGGQLSNRIRLFIKDFTTRHTGYEYYDLRKHEGYMRTLMIRTSSTGEVMVVVVFAYEEKAKREALLDALVEAFPEITSLIYVVNSKLNDAWGDQEVFCYAGEDHIWEEMEGLRYKIGPKSFYQTNSKQALRLYQEVRKLANLQGDELVYDLYTGTGTIASFVSRNARRVVGIEYVEAAIEDACINREVNGLKNLDFFAGDMKEVLTDSFIAEHGTPEVLITDPPRAGMHPDVVQTILRAAPKRIVYVSCNPATQARDVEMMKEAYEVVVAQPVDMFPHTSHVENILLLERR